MLVEWLMHRYGWLEVWYAAPRLFRHSILYPRFGGRFHVGVWTGPQFDLLCLKRCETNEEAKEWLSPGGRTIFLAAIAAVLRWMVLVRRLQPD